jgi:flagellar basal body-associated protein FliL
MYASLSELLDYAKVYLIDLLRVGMRAYISFFLLLILSVSFAQNQDSTSAQAELRSGITAEVFVDRKEVPQNQTVTFTVKVSWAGDLNRYEIERLENPILNNLEQIKNASSNLVEEVNGVKHAVKTYDFVLKPQELGMAYIDALIIEYRDNEYEETHSLVTNRLEVKIIDPILPKDYTLWFVSSALLVMLALASVGAVSFIKRKQAKEAERRAQELAAIPIEVNYLSELPEKVDLKSMDLVASFSELSKFFRRYLSERYSIPALETTGQEICSELNKLGISEKIIEQTDEVLKSCDVAKFSGGNVEREALQRGYTLVEDILARNKTEFSQSQPRRA